MRLSNLLRSVLQPGVRSISVFGRDVGNGLLEVSHNGLVMLGLSVVIALAFVFGRAELRQQGEAWALGWLQQREEARAEAAGDMPPSLGESDAVSRATAVNPAELSRQQVAVAKWISRRYGVAPEPVARLVQEAWTIGQHTKLEPTLILAIVAIESRFNPFAQSAVGAQGLMQVMTRIHSDKYEAFGGAHAAFDPISNLKVGVQVLRECIARAGSLQEGLRWYVGAANLDDDGGYINRVLSEQRNLQRVADGQKVSPGAPSGAGTPVVSPRVADAVDALGAPPERDAQQVAMVR